jgi:hypothetical protein
MPLTPGEKVDRVERILDHIRDDVIHAIILRAYFSRGAYDGDDVRKRFANSDAVRGFNVVRASLHFELIVTMARLFDDPDKRYAEKTASIPILMQFLSDNETLSELKRRSIDRKAFRDLKDQDGQPVSPSSLAWLEAGNIATADQEMRDIRALISEYDTFKGDHLIGRIRNARNDYLAHTSLEPNKNNRAVYGNAEALLDKTIDFVKRLGVAVRSCHVVFEKAISDWKEQSDIFWSALACGGSEKASGGPPTSCFSKETN